MVEHNDISIAHMSMIQGIVTRLETNCFTLKAMTMTLAVALLALMGSIDKPNWVYPMAGCLPVTIFWIMDAHYLRLGRLFRRLFNDVRKHKIDDPFSMNIKPYFAEEQPTMRIAVSWSVFWYYATILLTFAFITIFFLYQTKEVISG
jgi:hypothetical protein